MNKTLVSIASRTRSLGLSILLAALCFGLNPAPAQVPPPETKLDEIARQIKTLQQAVEELRQSQPAKETPPSKSELAPPSASGRTNDPIARIREEGLDRSQVMKTLSYLTDVIGPRLTGSPNLRRANAWTRDKLASWGLTNAHLEAWGPFGRGWSLRRFSAQIVAPQTFPLAAFPKAWSPGLERPLEAEVVYFDAKSEADLDQFKGKLKGAVVLISPPREVKAHFEPLAVRMTDTNLLRLANAGERRPVSRRANRRPEPPPPSRTNALPNVSVSTTNQAAAAAAPSRPPRRGPGRPNFSRRILPFLAEEGAALLVSSSYQGDGGTLFVASASLPSPEGRPSGDRPRPWSTNAPVVPAQITVASEDYNRMIRMMQQGEKLKMAVDLEVEFHDRDRMAYNTIAEIPGHDLPDEVVMLGAHMDSWHSGTGATDNGAGVAAVMEVARILTALDLQPRRTVRVALWTGEEQGLLGSKAYVARHFGYYTNQAPAIAANSSTDGDEAGSGANSERRESRPRRQLVRLGEYDKLDVYFNLDYGAGKIRGVYLQGNEAVRPLFRQWLQPFEDLDAATLTYSGAGGTDHLSFDAIALPGFQFIQDPLEYWSRTHHSNADVFDRVQPDDLKQAATIMAAFVYEAAMLDEKLPHKEPPER
jgi:carboxypeptidase Q